MTVTHSSPNDARPERAAGSVAQAAPLGAVLALTGALPTTGSALGTPVTFDAGPDAVVLEGSLLTRTIAIADGNDDGDPGWTYSIEYGDGIVTVGTTLTPTIELQHPYGNGPAAYVATVIVTDVPGDLASGSFAVTVQNVTPTIIVTGAAATTPEGATYTFTIDATDPGDARAQLSYFVDWNDGISAQVNRPLGTASHIFRDDEDGPANATTHTLLVSVYDDAGVARVLLPVVVTDVAPTIAVAGAASVPVGAPYSLTLGAITDPARTDTVTSRTINWGDGTSDVVSAGGAFTHTYATSGTRTVTVDLVNEDGTHLAAGSLVVAATPVAPAAPTSLTAAATSKSVIQLSWTNSSTDQTAVYVERCKNAGCTTFTRIATLSGSATSYRNTGLSSRTTYTYRVQAQNTAGLSAYSNTVTATTPRR